MENFKEMELLKIPYSKLLKIELPRFALRVIGIVERHNPEELQIEEIFDLLVAEGPRISKLIDKYGPHPLTEELTKLRSLRALYISAIRFHLKVVIREDKSGTDKDVKLVREDISHFLKNLDLSKNEEMYNQKVTQFFEAIGNNQKLSDALSSLDFSNKLDQLESVHLSIQRLIDDKLVSISERPRETTAELVKAVLTATKNLIKQIEIAPLKHTELDYTPLFNELNELFIEYRNLINKRILFNKRKSEEMKNGEGESTETTEASQTTESNEPTESTNGMMHLNGEEVDLNELLNRPVEKDNAVAMSSKTKQLPLIDDKDTEA